MYRKTYLEVDLDAITKNFQMVQQLVHNKIVIPVVKANAYGHGVHQVVKRLVDEGVRFFAVSLLEEAIEIRKKFPDVTLLMMGVCNPNDFEVAANYDIHVTIGSMHQLEHAVSVKNPLFVHLKIDTGMNRLGFKDYQKAKEAVAILKSHKYVQLEGIYTHFATADNDYDYYNHQITMFESFLSTIDYTNLMIHVSNSSSAIKYEMKLPYTTHVRLGISLYGLTLDEETTFLKNTCKLISHISDIKHLKKGEKIGYGATYQVKEDEMIAVLPIGYADGFIRKNQGGFVEINEKRYEIVGRICMDQMFVRIDKHIKLDTKVVLFGGAISIDEVANRLDTINYEVICQVTSRVPKVYK